MDDFGIASRKKKTPTAATKAAAVQKAKTTRSVTGVLGPKQRKAKAHAVKDPVVTANPPQKSA